MNRIRKLLLNLTCLILIAVPVIAAVDWLRQPDIPADSGQVRLTLLDGSATTLAEMSEQRPLLVYYWAEWCPVCRLTTPVVAGMTARGENVLAVTLRSGNDQHVERLMAGKKLRASGINDADGALARRWKVAVTPTFIFVYKGKVVTTTSGWSSLWGLQLRLWLAKLGG